MEIRRTRIFDRWLLGLKDTKAVAVITQRIDRLAEGNPGDHKKLPGGVSELRIRSGPAYRVYYTHRGERLILLLCGGDKSSQSKDIERARRLAAEL